MTYCSQLDIESLAATASRAAAYIDDCDSGASDVRLDPDYYLACSHVLVQIFKVCDARHNFPMLLEHSAAAREVDEAFRIAYRIELNRSAFYPELDMILRRSTA
ncbi:MAG: hypothetical protein KGP14_03870 [Betaproteobacteria bacterium]|nr:hypothetical protein [Betaproteobacteria bacterium]